MQLSSIADLCDNNQNKEIQVLPPKFKNFGGKRIFKGQVQTIKLHKSNWGLIDLLNQKDGKGKVLIVDVEAAFYGVVGDKLSLLAENANYEALIINGYVRDTMETKNFNIGLLALGTCALRNFEKHETSQGIELSFENTLFREGDYIYSDEDGVIISHDELK